MKGHTHHAEEAEEGKEATCHFTQSGEFPRCYLILRSFKPHLLSPLPPPSQVLPPPPPPPPSSICDVVNLLYCRVALSATSEARVPTRIKPLFFFFSRRRCSTPVALTGTLWEVGEEQLHRRTPAQW